MKTIKGGEVKKYEKLSIFSFVLLFIEILTVIILIDIDLSPFGIDYKDAGAIIFFVILFFSIIIFISSLISIIRIAKYKLKGLAYVAIPLIISFILLALLLFTFLDVHGLT